METNSKKLSIREWPEDDRPREKVLRNGVSSLSKSELLAILIGSGNAEESAVELMKKVLASCNDSIAELSKLTVDELCSFKGIGSAKAITIIAACELWKRRKEDDRDDNFLVRTSQDVYDYFYPLLCDLVIEECHVLLLNNMNDKRNAAVVNRQPHLILSLFHVKHIAHFQIHNCKLIM